MTGYAGTLAFGTNKISIAGAAATVYTGDTTYSVSGTPRMDFVYPGRTGTRQISPGVVTDANSINTYITAGVDIIGLTNLGVWRTLDFTGFGGSITTNSGRSVAGNLVLSSTMSVSTGIGTTTFTGNGTHSINTNGIQYPMPVTINSSGGSYTLLSNMDLGLARTFTISGGTFDAASYNVSMGLFATSGTTTKVVNMGSGTWTISSTGTPWTTPAGGNLTWNPNTSTMSVNSSSTSIKTLSPAGQSNWNNFVINSQGQVRITANTTINNFTVATSNATMVISSGVYITITTGFTFAGNSTVQSTLSALTPGSIAYVSSGNGNIFNPSYLTITDVGATGGARWRTYDNVGNINGGNAPGWLWYQSNVSNTVFFEWLA